MRFHEWKCSNISLELFLKVQLATSSSGSSSSNSLFNKSFIDSDSCLAPSDVVYASFVLDNIGSGNGLSPMFHQSIICTSADLLSIRLCHPE